MEDIDKLQAEVRDVKSNLLHIFEELYKELMKKQKRIEELEKQAKEHAKYDTEKMKPQTTAEAKSFLKSKFKYWINKLSDAFFNN